MANIYLASPFFNEDQESRITAVRELLAVNETVGNVYVPEQHQLESEEIYSFKWQQGVFKQDYRQVVNNDVVVCILDYITHEGEIVSDVGSVWEAGAAYASNVPVVYVQFDHTSQMNLMVAASGTAFFEEDQIKGLATYDFNNLPQTFTTQPVF